MTHDTLESIRRMANRTWETRGHARPRDIRDPLYWRNAIVGFVTPVRTGWGYWRHGPIFVLPEFRRRGLVLAYYAEHPERTCVAFVADDNTPSRALHDRSGFRTWRRGNAGWFMRREALT